MGSVNQVTLIEFFVYCLGKKAAFIAKLNWETVKNSAQNVNETRPPIFYCYFFWYMAVKGNAIKKVFAGEFGLVIGCLFSKINSESTN